MKLMILPYLEELDIKARLDNGQVKLSGLSKHTPETRQDVIEAVREWKEQLIQELKDQKNHPCKAVYDGNNVICHRIFTQNFCPKGLWFKPGPTD